MHGPTHLTVGILSGVSVSLPSGDWRTVAAGAGLGALGGLLPDWFQLNLPGLARNVRGLTGHRGFSHWLLTAAAATWALHGWLGAASLALGAGWISHLLLDMLAGGVPVLWPFVGRITVAHIKTGSRLDKLFGGAGLALTVVLILGGIP